MRFLLFCALFVVVLCRPSDGDDKESKGKHGHGRHRRPEPEFLKEVSKDGKAEWEKIFKNEDLTRGQMKEEIGKWAKKQGDKVEKAVKEFEGKHEKQIEEGKKNLTRTLEKLPEVMKKLTELRDNEKLTRKERREKTHEILSAYDDQTASASRFLLFQSWRGHGKRWGGRRHGKEEGGKGREHAKKGEKEKTDEEEENSEEDSE